MTQRQPSPSSAPDTPGPRLAREMRTVEAMVRLSCHGRHGTPRGTLCDDCRNLLDYALARLRRCPFGEQKTTCVDCPVHCYKPAMREAIRDVMRDAGPRMLLHHPWLALRHLLDGRSARRRVESDTDQPCGHDPGPSPRHRLAWIGAAFLCIYLPYAWILIECDLTRAYGRLWLRLWPLLPGLWVAFIPTVHRQADGVAFFAMALVTLPTVGAACRLAARGGVVAGLTCLVVLLASSFNAWLAYQAYRM